ncbi:MAG: type II toxin-antitoxin system VapC family toxin [Haliscomenobacter sp.]|nr:type II toxin-antitoxin system VapC family toxin [Haliscomenobacter sp.]
MGDALPDRYACFLWFNEGSSELSPLAKNLIEATENEIWVSIASLWEMAIKNSLGKLTIGSGYDTVLEDVIANQMEILPINFAHTSMLNRLPFHHRDPFDRMIIAQAIVESLNVISADESFNLYFEGLEINRIW